MKAATLAIYKSLYRKKLLRLIRSIPAAQRNQKNRRIARRLSQLSVYKQAKNILFYMALPYEVETRGLIQKALRAKKSIFLPKMNPRTAQIDICQIHHLKRDLKPGPWGIAEPKESIAPYRAYHEIQIVVAPGLGFDAYGNRLGRGGGYFDRLLPKMKNAYKIGLAFTEQRMPKIPCAKWDYRLDKLITD